MKKKILSIVLVILILACVGFLIWKFIPMFSEQEPQVVATVPNDQAFALEQVMNYVKTLPEYDELNYTIDLTPSRLKCAGCFVGVLTITDTKAEKYFDIAGTVVTQSSDGANIAR
ncbi:MAG: hypothetical protein Q4G02_02480 [bacterium]|nr:hypothetical protein [bacterium]